MTQPVDLIGPVDHLAEKVENFMKSNVLELCNIVYPGLLKMWFRLLAHAV